MLAITECCRNYLSKSDGSNKAIRIDDIAIILSEINEYTFDRYVWLNEQRGNYFPKPLEAHPLAPYYFNEARFGFINGHYISSMFSYITLVDLIARMEYVKEQKCRSNSKQCPLILKEVLNDNFGGVLKKIKIRKESTLKVYTVLPDLERFNGLRNDLIVHPKEFWLPVDFCPSQEEHNRQKRDSIIHIVKTYVKFTKRLDEKKTDADLVNEFLSSLKLLVGEEEVSYQEIIDNNFTRNGVDFGSDGLWKRLHDRIVVRLMEETVKKAVSVLSTLYPPVVT